MLRGYKKEEFVADPRKCILARGESFGDRRYRYKNWWCLTSSEKSTVRGRYPHSTPGIPDAAYAYPIKANGKLASASRTLIWGLKRVKRKVRR